MTAVTTGTRRSKSPARTSDMGDKAPFRNVWAAVVGCGITRARRWGVGDGSWVRNKNSGYHDTYDALEFKMAVSISLV